MPSRDWVRGTQIAWVMPSRDWVRGTQIVCSACAWAPTGAQEHCRGASCFGRNCKTKKTEKLCKPTTIDAAITFSFSWFFFCSGDIPQSWLVSWLTRPSLQTQHQRHRLFQNKRVLEVLFYWTHRILLVSCFSILFISWHKDSAGNPLPLLLYHCKNKLD